MTQLHIVHLVSSLQVGGMEQFVVRIAARQRESGHKVTIFALQPDGKLESDARKKGVEVVCPYTKNRLLRGIRAALTLNRLKPDIIHAHNPVTLQYAALGKRVTKAPLVLTCHGRGKGDTREPTLAEWEKVDAIVAVSAAVASEIRRVVQEDRVMVIHNGIEPTPTTRTREEMREMLNLNDALVGIIVARIDHLKGHDTLLRACHILHLKGTQLTVLIVGDGAERANREALSQELGLPTEQIRFLGFRSDVPDLLVASDIFLLPSLTEGLPLSVLEAMSAGLPVIATRVGGVPEVLSEGREGFLVEPNRPDQLAEAIERLTQDPSLRATLGENGRKRSALEFSFDTMLKRYESLYEELHEPPFEPEPK